MSLAAPLSQKALQSWMSAPSNLIRDVAARLKAFYPAVPGTGTGASRADFPDDKEPLEPTGRTLIETAEQNIARIEQSQQDQGYDDSFFVADLAQLEHQHALWQEYLPSVKPYYAVKCNPDTTLVRHLLQLGTGFDCASVEEMQTVLRLGAHGSDIIYANPCKAANSMAWASEHGIQMTTFDNLDELDAIKDNIPDAQLILRIFANDSSASVALGEKYGASMASTTILLKRAKELGLNVIGVSFHIGSGARNPNVMKQAIEDSRRAWSTAESLGFHMSILDIGGGFQASNPEFRTMAAVVMDAISSASFPRHAVVIAEPGRFYARSVFSLVCRVIARRRKTGEEPDDDQHEMLYQNDGVFKNFINGLVENEEFTPEALIESGANESKCRQVHHHEYSIWGPTCDSSDIVARRASFHCEVKPNDWLVYGNMGAYTSVCATRFNGFSNVTKTVYTRLR